MNNSVAYTIEAFYDVPEDRAQIIGKVLSPSSSGLSVAGGDESIFVAFDFAGIPTPSYDRPVMTSSGFVLPDRYEVASYNPGVVAESELLLPATNYAELSDQMTVAYHRVRSWICSRVGIRIVGGPVVEPNPAPDATNIAMGVCLQLASDGNDVNIDDELASILENGV